MSEYVRSVSVHIEVDTNKQTHVLDLPDADLEEALRLVADFFEECGISTSVTPPDAWDEAADALLIEKAREATRDTPPGATS